MSKIFKETFVIRIIHDTKRLGVQLSKNAEIKSVSFRLQHYWMNFAKYDDPTPTTQNAIVPAIEWTRYSKNIEPWLLVS